MLKENKKNYGKNQKGSTAVEFALIAIIFITVLFAIMEAGRIFWTQNTLQYAIEVASRELLVDNSLSEAEVEAIAAQKIEEFFISSAPFSADVVLTTESDVDVNSKCGAGTVFDDATNTCLLEGTQTTSKCGAGTVFDDATNTCLLK